MRASTIHFIIILHLFKSINYFPENIRSMELSQQNNEQSDYKVETMVFQSKSNSDVTLYFIFWKNNRVISSVLVTIRNINNKATKNDYI